MILIRNILKLKLHTIYFLKMKFKDLIQIKISEFCIIFQSYPKYLYIFYYSDYLFYVYVYLSIFDNP